MQIDEGVDILCPDLKTVNGCNYRRLYENPIPGGRMTRQKKGRGSSTWTADVYEDEPITCKLSSEESKSGKGASFKITHLETPSYFHKYLVGRGGAVKKRLENETGTEITIPKPYENKDSIQVKHWDEDSLASLEIRVNDTVERARRQERPTHFISIPVYSNAISENLGKFEDLVQEMIHPHHVQNPEKLHLTVSVLKLFSKNEIEAAISALNEFAPRIPYILCGRPLRGSLKNLEIMNDEPDSVRVLYSEVTLTDESDRLQQLADQCLEFLIEKGLVDEHTDTHNRKDVKLHCTLINTRWTGSGPQTFDATQILSDDWELTNFGDFVLEKMQLNSMQKEHKGKEGYESLLTLKLV